MEPITSFSGQYSWLSNFHRRPLLLPGWPGVFPTAGHNWLGRELMMVREVLA